MKKYGRKNIILYNINGRRVGQYYCYKKLKTAVYRAVDLVIIYKSPIQIWDEDAGKELAWVGNNNDRILVNIPQRSTFRRIWTNI